jgi:hypothetical protein
LIALQEDKAKVNEIVLKKKKQLQLLQLSLFLSKKKHVNDSLKLKQK